MQELKQSILGALRFYQNDKKIAALLRHELEFPVTVTPEEQLEVMAFSRGAGLPGSTTGHVSDKTYHIALNYQQQAERQNRLEALDLSLRLEQMERRLYRLEYSVSQLSADQAAVIEALYFKGMTQREVAESLNLAASTVKRHRDRALNALVDMYRTLQEAGVILNW